jgi:hypothetical protein
MRTPPSTIPEGLDLINDADGVTIRKVWRTWLVAPLAIFAIFWDGFLFFWYSQAISQPSMELKLMILFFPLIHVAAGVGITYYVIASLFNKTDVVISLSGIKVSTYPFPWFGSKEVKREEITDIIVRERIGNRNRRTYAIMYVDFSKKERKLIASIPESDQAEFIEQTIRDTTGIRKPA